MIMSSVVAGEFRFHEGVLMIPAAMSLADRTINVLASTDPDGFGLTVNRDQLGQGEALGDYLARQRRELQSKLPRFSVTEEIPCHVGGHPGLFLRYTWGSNGEQMAHAQTFIELRGRVIVVTGSSKAPLSDLRGAEIASIVSSIRFYEI
jgi:hypothetical protein